MEFSNLIRNLNEYYSKKSSDNYIKGFIDSNILLNKEYTSEEYLWEDLRDISSNSESLNFSYLRLRVLSESYNCKDSKYYKDSNLFSLIKKSLLLLSKYYNKDAKQYGNWWYWKIGIPFHYGCICLLIGEVDDNYRDIIEYRIRRYIKSSSCDLTYANMASICRNLYIGGAVCNNEKYINEAIKYGANAFEFKSKRKIKIARWFQKFFIKNRWLPYKITLLAGKEGFYSDGTFIQHTSVPYIGTYGIEMLEFGALLYATNKNTGIYIINEIKRGISKIINSYFMSIYKNEMMVMYCGRTIDTCNPKSIVDSIYKYVNEICSSSATYSDSSYDGDFAHLQPNSDKMLYQKGDWRFAVSMCSDRIAKYESFSGQNTRGWYQNLGMTYLYTPNLSYKGYLGIISPYYLPGVTCSDKERKVVLSQQPYFNYTKEDINNLRSGGCLLTHDNISAMLNVCDENVHAKKSWFVMGKHIFCIGTDIQGEDVKTTVYNGPLKINNGEILYNGDNVYVENYGNILFNNTKYSHIEDGEGNIIFIDSNMNHGEYEYVLTPLEKDMENNYPFANITTYKDENVHGIYDFKKNIYMFNFWKEHEVKLCDISIKSEALTAIGIMDLGDSLILDISDITQEKSKMKISIKGEFDYFKSNVNRVKRCYNDGYTKLTVKCKDKFGDAITLVLNKK
jgi:hyaluronate lyase